jgi:UDP-2,4-diacetamido-2,4,6-trideoxy-beta-L-altropyranose hydrolase
MLRLRIAEAGDVKEIYDIRNDEAVLRFFLDSEPVNFESHKVWYEAVLLNPKRELFVIVDDKDGILGVVRFDLNDTQEEAEVSVFVGKSSWGKGVATFALSEGEKALIKDHPKCKAINAKVLSGNDASLKLFHKCAYVSTSVQLKKTL